MATTSPVGASDAGDIGSASSGEEFDAGTGSEQGGGDPSFDAAPRDAVGVAQPAAASAEQAQRFKFGRREWPSQERAEQEFLSTVGRLQAAQRRMAEVEADRDALREAMKRGGGGSGEAGASGAQQAVAEAVDKLLDPDSLDWELITGAMKERGPEVGMYLFAQKLSEALGKGFDARIGKVMEPFKGMHEGSQRAIRASQLWDGAVTAVDEAGSMYFPELSEPQNLQTAMAIWREITDGMPEEVAMHPRMARMAILEMRAMLAAEGGGAASSTGSGSAGAGSAVDPGAVAQQAARAAGARARGRGVLPPGRGQQPGQRAAAPETEEQRIRRSLMQSGQETGALGFRR